MSQSDYVVAAYAIVFVTVLVYVALSAAPLARRARATAELAELAQRRRADG